MDIPTDPLILSPDDIRALCRLAGLADPGTHEDAATLALAEGPEGWRCWIAEYPEEGSVPVHRTDGGAAWDGGSSELPPADWPPHEVTDAGRVGTWEP